MLHLAFIDLTSAPRSIVRHLIYERAKRMYIQSIDSLSNRKYNNTKSLKKTKFRDVSRTTLTRHHYCYSSVIVSHARSLDSRKKLILYRHLHKQRVWDTLNISQNLAWLLYCSSKMNVRFLEDTPYQQSGKR